MPIQTALAATASRADRGCTYSIAEAARTVEMGERRQVKRTDTRERVSVQALEGGFGAVIGRRGEIGQHLLDARLIVQLLC